MRRPLSVLALAVACLVPAGAAQAVVLHDATSGVTAGVALVPGTRALTPGANGSLASNWTPVTDSSGTCADPAASPDLTIGPTGLCLRGGSVLPQVETFALRWDRPSPDRAYWSSTLSFVQTFLHDVSAASGTLSSPFSVASQYRDAQHDAAGASWLYGGGCSDLGSVGSTCTFPSGVANGPGNDYPASSSPTPNCESGTSCTITDTDVQHEVAATVRNMGLLGHLQPGYQPMIAVLTPPNVDVCLDPAGTLCSADASASRTAASFCAYHSQVAVDGTQVTYVVQPWTIHAGCDEPNIAPLPIPPSVAQVETDAGVRLVNPLSQGMLDAATNPTVSTGWIAHDGSEMSDANGCAPEGISLDTETVGANSYYLQREWNNAFTMVQDPWTYGCAPQNAYAASFTAPSPIERGDVVAFDGSDTISTLLVPRAGYSWSFGDGSTAVGPSVVHTFAAGGVYTVTLTTTDRGGLKSSASQRVTVLPLPTTKTPGGATGPAASPPAGHPKPGTPKLTARLQLLPQSLGSMLRSGIAVRISSNLKADGLATLYLPKAYARQAHLRTSRASTVVIGRGTIAGVRAGTITLHIKIPHATAVRLAKLRRVTLTLRVSLRGPASVRQTIDAAGRY